VGPRPDPIPEPKAEDADFPPLKLIELDVVDPATNKGVGGVKLAGRVNNQARTWMTGEDGHVKLDVDGGAKSLSIAATKDGYVPTTVTWAAAPRGEGIPSEYLMRLERGTTIGGRVVDEAGQPIAGVDVALHLERKGERSVGPTMIQGERVSLYNLHVKTDPDGRWHFDQAPGRIDPARVQLVHPDFLSDELLGQRTAPPEEKLRDQSSVMVMVKGVRVAGRVTDPAGKPVAGAQVSLGVTRFGYKSPTSRSGADGAYVLANCRPGQRATLIVRAKGRAPSMTQFQLDDAGATRDVQLEAARVMRIRVVDAKGRPVQGRR
jgi:protocatechuate 3,4-dioxygenase beta subunit